MYRKGCKYIYLAHNNWACKFLAPKVDVEKDIVIGPCELKASGMPKHMCDMSL